MRFGLKRGKLLYLFKYPTHDVERDKHRNVIARARHIKSALEDAGYRLVPWDFKKAQPPPFWEQQTMEEDDDDLYGPSETVAPVAKEEKTKGASDGEQGDESMDEGLESGESEDESDSDSVLHSLSRHNWRLTQPRISKSSLISRLQHRNLSRKCHRKTLYVLFPNKHPSPQPQESKAIKIEAPPKTTTTSATKPSAIPTQPGPHLPSGADYPAIHSSTIDVNGDPVYPPAGKPISQVEIDSADLQESSKPWRLPGSDQSDYFNYGFDEFTWELYRQRQLEMHKAVEGEKSNMATIQQLLGGGPMPGMGGMGGMGPGMSGPPAMGGAAVSAGVPGAPTGPAAAQSGGMPTMPGMPITEYQMQQATQYIIENGMDMNAVGFDGMVQIGQSFPPTAAAAQQQQQQGGYGVGGGGHQGHQGGGGRGGGRRGRGGW